MCGASRWRTFRRVTLHTDAAGADRRRVPVSFIRGYREFRIAAVLRHAGRHRRDHDRDLQLHQPPVDRRNTSMPRRSSFVDHGADVPAGPLAVAAAARPQFPDRDGQGLFARGHRSSASGAGSRSRFCVLFFVITVVLPVGQLLIGSFFQFFGFYSWDMLTLEHYQRGPRATASSGAPSATPCCSASSARRPP